MVKDLIYKVHLIRFLDLFRVNILELNMIYIFPMKSYLYLSPESRLDIRWDENDQLRPGEEPVSLTV